MKKNPKITQPDNCWVYKPLLVRRYREESLMASLPRYIVNGKFVIGKELEPKDIIKGQ